MRISDWSSDVCSSDLVGRGEIVVVIEPADDDLPPLHGLAADDLVHHLREKVVADDPDDEGARLALGRPLHELGEVVEEGGLDQIGRASWRGRLCQYA